MVRPCLVRTVSRLRRGSFRSWTSLISVASTVYTVLPFLAARWRRSFSNLTADALLWLRRWSRGTVLVDVAVVLFMGPFYRVPVL